MPASILPADLNDLSVDDRLLLIEALWDSIVEAHETLEVTAAQRQELDRRLKAHRASPENVVAWDEVKSRLKLLDE